MARKAPVVVWAVCDVYPADHLYLYEAARARLSFREVRLAAEGSLGRFEAMALIVRSHVELLIEGTALLRRTRTSPQLELRGGHGIRLLSPPKTLYRFSSASLGVRVVDAWSVHLEYAYRWPSALLVPPVRFSMRGHDLRLSGAVHYGSGQLALETRIAAACSRLAWKAQAQQQGEPKSDTGTTIAWGAELALAAGWRPRPWLQLAVVVGASYMVADNKFVFTVDEEPNVLLNPARVQPFASLSVVAHLGPHDVFVARGARSDGRMAAYGAPAGLSCAKHSLFAEEADGHAQDPRAPRPTFSPLPGLCSTR